MPDPGEIRWFRYGSARWALAITLAGLGIWIPLTIIIDGSANRSGVAIVLGAILLLVCLMGAYGMLRAGIGVTPDQVLIRSGIGTTEAIPWSKVARFEVRVDTGRTSGLIDVFGTDGQRRSTFGCVAGGSSRRETLIAGWQLVSALEAERLKHAPGAAATASSPVPRPALPPWTPRGHWVPRVLGSVALLVIIAGTAWLGSWALGSLGPAFRAADAVGTLGYFIPQSGGCGRCSWSGEFRLPDGTVTLRNVTLNDAGSGVRIGLPVPARDTGDGIYPASDPGAWGPAMAVMVESYCTAALFAAVGIAPLFRRRTFQHLTGDTTPAWSDAPSRARGVPDAAAALVEQRGWRFSPPARQGQKQNGSTPATGRQLGRLNGALDGRLITVVLCERVTSVLIGLPTGAVPKVRIKIDRGSGQLVYTENAALGQRLMTEPAREAVSQAGFTAVIFSKNELAGALPRALTAAEIIDALHGVEKLLAAMPRDVLGAYGVLRSDGVGDAANS